MERPKILIVDDRIENLISLEMILLECDVDVVKATSGMEGLRKTMQDDFALAILDVQMPGMDGYETLSLIRKRVKTKYLPVIFVSAIHQSDLHIIKGIETGAVDFIPKPIIPEILIGKVRIFLELHSQKQKLTTLLKELGDKNKQLEIQTQKAEDATHAKAMFLANMSHEIRTPLNGIIGISKALEETNLDDTQKELTEIITTSGENLANIINDILDFSKIESGQVVMEYIEFTLNKVLNTIASLLRFNSEKKGLDLIVEIDDKIPNWLIGDPYRLNQIITNLANNAIKFTEKGFVKISVELIKKDNNKTDLIFKVTDTGIGISKEGKDKLFKEFSQTDSSTTRKYGGTGLGLAISRNLTTLMKGDIGVNSEVGKGSEFWLKLSFDYLNETSNKMEKPIAEKVVTNNDSENQKKIKVLYAEDNLINQRVTSMLLQKMKITCDIANDGLEALEMYKSNQYDLILMDMQMPKLDGIQATEKIREYEKNDANVKPVYIVAVTANTFSSEKQKCMEAGMNNFISKPFKENELSQIIQNVKKQLN